ncbi:hypothetical protein [Achromobacter denitrificans]|uniref:hypothetical protein n=1 Tax=Achromobacter denitrificans TaxID=32002 RepID=UPI003BA2CF73
MRQQKRPRDESDVNEDLIPVERQHAIDAVVACLAHEQPTAFGLTTKDWVEHLMNELADNQGGVLLVLLVGATIPSAGEFLNKLLGDCIDGLANRQLAQMSADEAEACL